MEYASLLVPLLVLGLILFLIGLRRPADAALARQVASIERRVSAIGSHLQVAAPQADHPLVLAELQQGRQVQAVKLYREETGAGLAEAKAAVDEIADQHGLPSRPGKAPLSFRLSRVERQLDALAAHYGLELGEPALPLVVEELRQGRKVQAIKVYRQETGADLVAAKNAVEELARKHGL
jgi:ribosomal protein L7/L12